MHSPSSVWWFFDFSGVQSLACRLVEQMDEGWVRLQPDLVARIELMTLAEHGDDLLAAELGKDLGFRTSRLDHDDLRFRAVVRHGEGPGADAGHRGPAF